MKQPKTIYYWEEYNNKIVKADCVTRRCTRFIMGSWVQSIWDKDFFQARADEAVNIVEGCRCFKISRAKARDYLKNGTIPNYVLPKTS